MKNLKDNWCHSQDSKQAHLNCSHQCHSLNQPAGIKPQFQNIKREDQQDATIRCLLLTSVSTCFRHHYVHLQENKGPVTAFGAFIEVSF